MANSTKRLSIKDVQKTAKEREGQCLSKTYTNTTTPMKWECGECGNKWIAIYRSVRGARNKKGTWCPKCSLRKGVGNIKNRKYTPEDIKKIAKDRNLKFLSKEFTSTKLNYDWECLKCGFKFNSRASSVIGSKNCKPTGCRKCSKIIHKIEDIQKALKKRKINLLTKKYKGMDHWYNFECINCGHKWKGMGSMVFGHIKDFKALDVDHVLTKELAKKISNIP